MDQQDIKQEQPFTQLSLWRQQGYFGFTNVTVLEGLAIFGLNSDAWLLHTLIYQVSNGGFAQWISNGYSKDLNSIAQYLEQIGSPTCMAVAQLLDQLSLWDSSQLGYELSATMGYFLEELDPFDKQRLNALERSSKEFWQISDQLCAELDAYFAQLPEAQKLVIMDPPLSHSQFLQSWWEPPVPTWIRLMEQVQQQWEFGTEAFFGMAGRGHLLEEFLPKLELNQCCAFLFGDLLFQSQINQGGAEQWLNAGGRFVLEQVDRCVQSMIATSDRGRSACTTQVAEVVRFVKPLHQRNSDRSWRKSNIPFQTQKQQEIYWVGRLNQLLQDEAFCHRFRTEVESYLTHSIEARFNYG